MNHLSAFFPDPRGVRLHYQSWEESAKGFDRIALLLHGLGWHSGSYARLLPAFLAKRYKVVAPDFAGFGLSPGERGSGGALAMADAVEALCRRIEAVEGRREIDIVAHSMGAIAALLFLKRYPARRVRLVAASPLIYGVPTELSLESLSAEEEERGRLAADPLFAASIPNALASDLAAASKEILADPSFLEGRKAAFFVGEEDPLVPLAPLKETIAALPLKDPSFASFPRARHGLLGGSSGEQAISAILAWLDEEARLEQRP